MSFKNDVKELNELMDSVIGRMMMSTSSIGSMSHMSNDDLVGMRDCMIMLEKTKDLLENWATVLDMVPEMNKKLDKIIEFNEEQKIEKKVTKKE